MKNMKEMNCMKLNMKNSLGFKVFFTGLLATLLMIPLIMVGSLVREREGRRNEAVQEVSSRWGHPQTIAGPILVVPYRYSYVEKEDKKSIVRTVVENAYFLPETVDIRGGLVPEKRSRGLYEVVLYGIRNLVVSGSFTVPDFGTLNIARDQVLWDQAYLAVGIPDTRGIQQGITMNWGGRELPFLPGVMNTGMFESGIHMPVANLRGMGAGRYDFSFTINLRGSSTLSFIPMGKDTSVEIDSIWPHPSFTGAYLPVQRRVGDDGFRAQWKVSHFGRNFPQEFVQSQMPSKEDLEKASFGVRLFLPVDFYQKCERAVKYGFLFISLTFLAFFLFELFNRLSVHPLQYLMVGFAMCLFYLLFLALSEHIGFLPSYGISSLGVMSLITGYSAKVLGTNRRAGAMFGLLFGLYAVLYVILENEDYALIMGAVILFAILAAVMYLTRNVDWYRIKLGPQGEGPAVES
jgi:inner membrane protein